MVKLEHDKIWNKDFLKMKIKSYGDEATDFLNIEIPKVGSNYTYLAVIFIDFVLKRHGTYYIDVFVK